MNQAVRLIVGTLLALVFVLLVAAGANFFVTSSDPVPVLIFLILVLAVLVILFLYVTRRKKKK